MADKEFRQPTPAEVQVSNLPPLKHEPDPGGHGFMGKDRQGGDLVDLRGGARDNIVPRPKEPMKVHSTPHQDAQHGADVRPETEPADTRDPNLKTP